MILGGGEGGEMERGWEGKGRRGEGKKEGKEKDVNFLPPSPLFYSLYLSSTPSFPHPSFPPGP